MVYHKKRSDASTVTGKIYLVLRNRKSLDIFVSTN